MVQAVINLYGGPGTGKSTTAAGVFSLLKMHNVSCELITEFAKDLTWEERHKTLGNQMYITAKQQHKIWRIPDEVEVVITDSPLILGILYVDKDRVLLRQFIAYTFKQFNNVNYFLNRVKPYSPIGRRQTEDEAKALDVEVRDLLNSCGVPFTEHPADWGGINAITEDILGMLDRGPLDIWLKKVKCTAGYKDKPVKAVS